MVSRRIFNRAIIIAFDPNDHRVRSVRPTNATISTRRSVLNRSQTGHVCPRVSQRHVSRRSSTYTHHADKLVLDLQSISGTPICLVSKVLLYPHLLDIGEIPIFRLNVSVELIPGPVFKTRIRKLIIICMSGKRHRHPC